MTTLMQTNDAAGGAGSFVGALQGIITGGLSRAVDGYLSKKFPLTSFNDNATVEQGEVRESSAPARAQTASEAALGFLKNPLVIGVGVAIFASLALVLALRK